MSATFKDRLENFWYHYKIPALLGAAALVFAVVVGVQMFNRTSYEMYVLYAGPANINDTLTAGRAIHTDIEESMAKLSGDPDLKTAVQSFVWISDERARDYRGNDVYFNPVDNQKQLQTFMDAVATGQCPIMLLDPALFSQVEENGALEKLSDKLGFVPEGAVDEYGVRLSDTPFGKDFAGFRELPEDTVICLRNLENGFALFGKSTGGEKWDRQVELFVRMMRYGEDTGD